MVQENTHLHNIGQVVHNWRHVKIASVCFGPFVHLLTFRELRRGRDQIISNTRREDTSVHSDGTCGQKLQQTLVLKFVPRSLFLRGGKREGEK